MSVGVASPPSPTRASKAAATRRIAEAVQHGVDVALQPIVDLVTGEVVGVEALARFPDGRAPDEWFAEASSLGLGTALELAAVEGAIARMSALPGTASLSVNVSAATAATPALSKTLAQAPPGRVVLEITEHVAVDDYPALTTALAGLRARGVRLAIDDAGAGFASLQHVLRLQPDVVKLDASLVRGMDSDPAQRAMVSALVSFASATGCSLVAEGVETAGELQTARTLGVNCGQGFHLGMPDADAPSNWQIQLPRNPGKPSNLDGSRRFRRPASLLLAAALSWPGMVAVANVMGPRAAVPPVKPPATVRQDAGMAVKSRTAQHPAPISVPTSEPDAARKVEANVPDPQPSPSRAPPPTLAPTTPLKHAVEDVTSLTGDLTRA